MAGFRVLICKALRKSLTNNDIFTPEQNNICADIYTGLRQAIASGVSCELHKMAKADAFSTLRILGWFITPSFSSLAKEAVPMLQARKRKGTRGKGGRGEYRSIFREIFVDLKRHYRCGARSRQPISPGIWRRRKRAVNPLFTRAYEPTGRRSLFEAL